MLPENIQLETCHLFRINIYAINHHLARHRSAIANAQIRNFYLGQLTPQLQPHPRPFASQLHSRLVSPDLLRRHDQLPEHDLVLAALPRRERHERVLARRQLAVHLDGGDVERLGRALGRDDEQAQLQRELVQRRVPGQDGEGLGAVVGHRNGDGRWRLGRLPEADVQLGEDVAIIVAHHAGQG